MSASPLKNVMLVGAAGSVGKHILSGLLTESSFTITILSRNSSTAKFPPNLAVKRVSDDFLLDELIEAFKGQDAVVLATSSGPIIQGDLANRLVDAAAAADVKRLIPSDFGPDILNRSVRKHVPVYDAKGQNLEYLIKKAEESEGRLTWTSFATGSWLDWALDHSQSGSFLGINVKDRNATIWDSGNKRLSATTLPNIGLAVARSLLTPAETANKQIFLSDFAASAREIIGQLEKASGGKFDVEVKESGPVEKEIRKKLGQGDYSGLMTLIVLRSQADEGQGFDFQLKHDVWNQKLGLPEVSLEDVAKKAVEINCE